MRIIVLSDSHGMTYYARKVFDRCADADMFIFLGDGENDIELIRELNPKLDIRSVAGNCDYGSMLPASLVVEAGGIKLFCTHGHHYGVKYGTEKILSSAKENGCAVALYGHTHVKQISFEDGIYIMNPGSCSCPRDLSKPSYGYIDITDKGIFVSTADV